MSRAPIVRPTESSTAESPHQKPVLSARRSKTPAAGTPFIAPEIAFLALQGVEPAVLLRAQAAAQRCNVSADVALLAEGLLGEEDFYQKLADHVGFRFLSDPPAIAADFDPGVIVAAGVAPLVPNAGGLSHVAAPQGEALRTFLGIYGKNRGERQGMAVVTPRRLATLAREAAPRPIAKEASFELWRHDPSLSAFAGLSYGQVAAISLAVGLVVFGLATNVDLTLDLVLFCCCLAFLVATVARLCAILTSHAQPRAGHRRAPDRDLPVYSVIVPLYREASVVRRIVAAVTALDYPATKLDIKFVVEACDAETHAALKAHDLAYRYEIIVAPPGEPRTKPRALNVALPFVRGKYTVVFDAEDEPDPGQLRAAAMRFSETSGGLACLQAKLVIDNIHDSWLTRMFAIEYAALFSVTNPGLCALRLPLMLGGSSNHFRTSVLHRVHGWDAWNVTEDADLGIRLARYGYRAETLDSTSFEEAPAFFATWLSQRRRWMKGWMQTLAVHARQPSRLFADLGIKDAIVTLLSMGCMLIGFLFSPLFIGAACVSIASGTLLHPSDGLGMIVRAVALAVLGLGLFNLVAAPWIGLARRDARHLRSWLWILPVYHGLLIAAAWCALIDLCRDPYTWRKTDHGLAKTSWRREALVARARPVSGPAPVLPDRAGRDDSDIAA